MPPRRKQQSNLQPGLFDDTAQVLTGFIPSLFQQAIFDWIVSGQGDGVVRACAGSGKSTVLIEGARLVKADRALFCAFNVHIVKHLETRLKGTPFTARTIHQVGYGVIARAFAGKPIVNERKYVELARRWVDERFPVAGKIPDDVRAERIEYAHQLAKLVRFVRMTRTDPGDRDAIRSLAQKYGVALREQMAAGVEQLLIWGAELIQGKPIIDFTDMIHLPLYLKLEVPKYPIVMVDEMQDLNTAQRDLVLACRAEGGRMLWVGDPRQAIMAFAGADSMSYDRIRSATGATEFPLSLCYRCPVTHIALAQEEVPEIQPRPGAPQGTIASIPEDSLGDVVQAGDLIICRTTAPLIAWCLKLIGRNIPARVRGRDIAADLMDLAHRVGDGGAYTNFLFRLAMYEREHRDYLEQQEASESALQLHADRCAALATCYHGFRHCTSIDSLCKAIDNLFDDEKAAIWLSTVHRAKGLEAERVFILHPELLPLVWEGQTEEEKRQEHNVRYVALTRSKDVLVFLENDRTIDDGSAEQREQIYGSRIPLAA